MSVKHVSGSANPVITGHAVTTRDREVVNVVVEGLYSALKAADLGDYVPSGYDIKESSLDPMGNGLGRLVIKAIDYESGDAQSISPVRSTIEIDMAEVQYDLEDHPHFAGTYREIILRWLATDETARIEVSGGVSTYYYKDDDGSKHQIYDDRALQFIAAFNAGIKNFVRFFPVVSKISIWKNPPGMSRSLRSFTGGSPRFSVAGYWDDPPVTLSGYPAGNWFKSKDSWKEKENTTWERTEQWTYTPDGSSGPHGWIYESSNGQNGQNNQGQNQ